jgi:transcription antitermination factor NusA-like protein
VPEIFEGIVRIEACAREPGARSKIAVSSRDRDVDPVGACVGIRGSRVQAVVQELRGEKIDIVPYNDDPARFVCNAIQPATVSRVLIDAERHTMELVVPDDKLSLAIGKKGQNVRLASRLTGWRIDIYSESKLRQMERRSLAEMAAIPGVGDVVASNLFQMGWRNLRDLAIADADELAQVPGIGSTERAESIIEVANDAASGKLQLTVKYPGRAPSARFERRRRLRGRGALSLHVQSLHAAPTRPTHTPMRTCVGCRVVRPQVELLRTRCPGGRVAATKAGAPVEAPMCVRPSLRRAGRTQGRVQAVVPQQHGRRDRISVGSARGRCDRARAAKSEAFRRDACLWEECLSYGEDPRL